MNIFFDEKGNKKNDLKNITKEINLYKKENKVKIPTFQSSLIK